MLSRCSCFVFSNAPLTVFNSSFIVFDGLENPLVVAVANDDDNDDYHNDNSNVDFNV